MPWWSDYPRIWALRIEGMAVVAGAHLGPSTECRC